jgi:hypothetical protein
VLRSASSTQSVLATGTTDANGGFPASTVEGRVLLIVTAPGYATYRSRVLAGQGPTLVRLDRSSRIRGRVSSSDGRPLQARLTATTHHPRNTVIDATASSQATGEFEFVGLLPGTTVIVARADGFSPAIVQVAMTEGSVVRNLNITMVPGASIEGILVDSAGVGVPDAAVSISYKDGSALSLASNLRHGSRVTGADGRFVLSNLIANTTIQIWASSHRADRNRSAFECRPVKSCQSRCLSSSTRCAVSIHFTLHTRRRRTCALAARRISSGCADSNAKS